MDKNRSIKQALSKALTKVGIILTAAWYGNIYVFSADPFDTAVSAVDEVRDGLVKVGKALFPVAIIVIVVSLFITHDERKLQMEIKIGIALCVAYILLVIFSSGDNLITQWLEGLAS